MTFRSECTDYSIAAIRALLQGNTIPALPESVSIGELFAFSKYHNMEAMVWHCLEQQNLDHSNPAVQKWENRAGMLLVQSMVQLQERDSLFAALQSAGIPILPVKGCWLKEQYPQIDYRQMSDLDILIHPEDAERARDIMISQGYRVELFDDGGNQDDYEKPPYMGVELHRSLLPKEDPNYSYYEDVWERAHLQEGQERLYRLTPEDEYIYYLLHLYKHLLRAGAGIRLALDSVIYRRVHKGMDKAYLQREYKKLGIAAFAEAIEELSDHWFDTGAPIPERLQAMAESLLTAGTYGTESQLLQNELEPLQEKAGNPLMLKLRYLLRLVFLPLPRMAELYPVLEKLPVLLPLFWIWRIIARLLFKPKTVITFIKKTNEAGDKVWSKFNWREYRSK